ncbi:MAG: cob(I)yrinic acid a,c-diamide adenosyltransferase [Propionibacteriaceae bacterium]|jgi:cob(I)alamin adenosyltransferase|nr:cob(I)yrinic acid a,c-diamide adenosyltransferase [Propionibacteriaceae bacterium]
MMTGLIHLYTGEGKGKTTAALGLALRAAGRGRRVLIVQFLKGHDSGELHTLSLLPTVTVHRLSHDYGFVRSMTNADLEAVRQEHDAMIAQAADALAKGEYDLVVLDEIAAAVSHGLIDTGHLLSLLDHKPEAVEIVMTGRDAREALVNRADYITEMRKIRHPFDQGVPAREGIEW